MNNLETTLEHAQKITLGQVDNGTLATAVTCAETLQIVRHGIVESYVIPKHLIDDLLLKVAVLECDNRRLLGDRVAESITVPKSHFFNHDFKVDMSAVTKSRMDQRNNKPSQNHDWAECRFIDESVCGGHNLSSIDGVVYVGSKP